MPFMSPRSNDHTELGSRRNLVNIPKDQQELLDRPEAWESHPQGFPNVPNHVIETVKQAHIAKQRQAIKEPATPKAPKNNSTLPPPTQSSSPTRSIAWSPSPIRHRAPLHAPLYEAADACLNDNPPKSSPVPPSSALDDDDDALETEIPQPLVHGDARVNRTAERLQSNSFNTPPCAQPTEPIIPNTVISEPAPERTVPEGRRRMKEILFDDGTTKRLQPVINRMAPTKSFKIPSSNLISSSSIIPATCDSVESTNTEQPQVEAETSRAVEVEERHPTPPPQTLAPLEAEPQPQPGYPPAINRQVVPITFDIAVKPYELFTQAYPEYEAIYSGNKWDFIKACLCVNYLYRRRELRECLYDDFIRAFSDSYVKYTQAAGPHQEPIPAVQWYNGLPGRPIFNHMLITSQNLSYILDCYSQECASARGLIADLEREDTVDLPLPEEPRKLKQQLRPRLTPTPAPPSQNQGPLTQPPPPPSPHLSTAPSSAISTPALKSGILSRKTRPSPYFSRVASGGVSKLAPRKTRTLQERERLREHFLNRRSSNMSSATVSSSRRGSR